MKSYTQLLMDFELDDQIVRTENSLNIMKSEIVTKTPLDSD